MVSIMKQEGSLSSWLLARHWAAVDCQTHKVSTLGSSYQVSSLMDTATGSGEDREETQLLYMGTHAETGTEGVPFRERHWLE